MARSPAVQPVQEAFDVFLGNHRDEPRLLVGTLRPAAGESYCLLSSWAKRWETLSLASLRMTLVRALDLHEPFAGETSPGRGGCQSSASGLPVTHVHVATDLAHGVDHLVR